MNLEEVQKAGEELERRLRLKSYPLAIKMLTDEKDIPKGAKRPVKDFGCHFDLCQAYATTRRDGVVMAVLKKDNWCCEPVIGYGLGEPPQYFLDGNNRYPQDVSSLEAGKNYASDLPRLPVGKYIGVLSAPLPKTPFIPDVVVIYADSEQLSLLLLAREHKDGHDLTVHLSSHAACVYGVVPSLKSEDFYVAVPCRGDHFIAMAGSDEMIFTIPIGKLDEIMKGLRFLETTGSRIPRNYRMKREPEHAESYFRIARMMGVIDEK